MVSATDFDPLLAVEDQVRGELPVHGAGADGQQPRRGVGHGAGGGPGVARRADHGDAVPGGVEGPDGDAVPEVLRGGSPQRDGEHVHAVVDGRVERRDDVGVEALAAVDGVPAHLVAAACARGAPPLAVP